MSRSNDPGHFFQTSSSIETEERKAAKSKNQSGDPIQLQSKILAVIPDPRPGGESCVFLAESAGTARLLDVRRREKPGDLTQARPPPKPTRKLYRGPAAPLTSLAISPDSTILFAGCWDKSIWSWDIETAQPKRKYVGHSDFVKSVLCASLVIPDSTDATGNGTPSDTRNLDIMISGSSDSTIIIWSIGTGQKLHTIRVGERASGILDLAIDPSSVPSAGVPPTTPRQHAVKSFTLFAASSDPLIRRWNVSARSSSSIDITQAGPDIHVHETSVNKLLFYPVPDDDDGMDDETSSHPFALFTASSDNTAKHLVRRDGDRTTSAAPGDDAAPAASFVQKSTFPHPDFVRAVAIAPSSRGHLLATACRDEEVRIFDLETAEPVHVFRGHFEEVTGLALLGVEEGNVMLVSVAIDGTVRRWDLDVRAMAAATLAEEDEREGTADGMGAEAQEQGVVRTEAPQSMLTEEEDAELAELMADDEDD